MLPKTSPQLEPNPLKIEGHALRRELEFLEPLLAHFGRTMVFLDEEAFAKSLRIAKLHHTPKFERGHSFFKFAGSM